jgi:hypothetical protein
VFQGTLSFNWAKCSDTIPSTGGGLVLTALAARTMFKNGVSYRIMAMNPWVVLGVSLVGTIGMMMGAMYTSPENKVQKHMFWLVSSVVSPIDVGR